MEEVDASCEDFGDDDDLGDAEAIQALTNAEKSHDEKPQVHIKVWQKQAQSISLFKKSISCCNNKKI